VLGWPIIQIAVSAIFLRLPRSIFESDSWITREWGWERRGKFYRARFAVHRWKAYLPDGAPWLGGSSKKHLHGRTRSSLYDFAAETRRAECAHWCMLMCTPVFFLWNPLWACFVMSAYGIAGNLPCILAQRANRLKIDRILEFQSSMGGRSRPCAQ
jgi:glycosyl-4,4'-diaponeurosporenoate acyltransferase